MAAASIAAAIAVSCGSPYAGSDLGVGLPDRGDAEADADAPGPGPAVDAAMLPDAVTADADGCAPTDCDCDHDGFLRPSCNGSGIDAAVVDCDDLDPNRHPGQSYVATIPPAAQTPSGDWNCDGQTEKFYLTGVVCTSAPSCAATAGFVGTPGCGMESDYVQCTPGLAGLGCMNGMKSKRTQGCR